MYGKDTYILRVADIEPFYYIIAAGISVIVWAGSGKWNKGLLAGYMFLILAVTVLNRKTGTSVKLELHPFWSYQQAIHLDQILLNIIMFIPVGLLSSSWKTIVMTVFFSAVIELSQLVSCRGLFEFDDVIHNTLGTVIGVGTIMILRNLWKRFKK